MRAMNFDTRMAARSLPVAAAVGMLLLAFTPGLRADDQEIATKLQGFDAYLEKVLKDWNAPAVGVGIVVNDKLVFAKGYGYRDYEKKLPFTPTTLCPIASNTKLFTAVAAGMLVEEGKLTWDQPVRDAVPAIRFYDNDLDNSVTLRDMLGHRTGITRHDAIWYKSDFTRKEIFERLRYLEPREPIRQVFLYNNLMYAAAGYLIELKTGKTWEEYVRARILTPLAMKNAVYSIDEMLQQPDHGVPFTEKRDTSALYRLPYYEDTAGLAPGGRNHREHRGPLALADCPDERGKVRGPAGAAAERAPGHAGPLHRHAQHSGRDHGLRGTLESGLRNGALDRLVPRSAAGVPRRRPGGIPFSDLLHAQRAHGCDRFRDRRALRQTLQYRQLQRVRTPAGHRPDSLERPPIGRQKQGQAGGQGSAGARPADRVRDTKPSHALADYVGEYVHPAFGVMKIELKDGQLWSDFHKEALPLTHFHYDRFDSPDDELFGKRSMNFQTNPQGDIDTAVLYLEEVEAVFTRKPQTLDPAFLAQLAGTYESPAGSRFRVWREGGDLRVAFPGQPADKLLPYKGLKFRVLHHADAVVEFIVENGQVHAMQQIEPAGVFHFTRK